MYDQFGFWKDILEPLDSEFQACLKKLSGEKVIHPPIDDILNAFKFCNVEPKVVILGQDPYYSPGVADGLAFSTRFEKHLIPPSLKAIYACLKENKFIGPSANIKGYPHVFSDKGMPDHGDLTPWAKRGVLLLNNQLTTGNEPNMHKFWKTYTDLLLIEIARKYPNSFYCFWGNDAISKLKRTNLVSIVGDHVLTYKHPSPQAGHWDCDHFNIINKVYQIDWDPFYYDLYICATDGSCKKNKAGSRATWAVYFPQEILGYTNSISKILQGELIGTNNIAEMTAIIEAFKAIDEAPLEPQHKKKIVLITDSEYCQKTLEENVWNDDKGYKNIEQRVKFRKYLERFVLNAKLTIFHVNSHLKDKEINAMNEPMKSFYLLNKKVDELTNF